VKVKLAVLAECFDDLFNYESDESVSVSKALDTLGSQDSLRASSLTTFAPPVLASSGFAQRVSPFHLPEDAVFWSPENL